MKKLLLACVAMLAVACSSGDDSTPVNNPDPVAGCDNVFNGDVVLSTQEEVNAFASHGYCEITGSLTIQSLNTEHQILGIQQLSSLKKIGGSLIIRNNLLLPSLKGLDNVEEISTCVYVEDNTALTNFEGLAVLQKLGDPAKFGFPIDSGDPLSPEYPGKLIVRRNQGLKSLEGLGSVVNLNRLDIKNNTSLLNLKGLEHLNKVASVVDIANNVSLLTLQGLDNIQSATTVSLSGNASLVSIEALSNLSEINEFGVSSHASLQNLKGLENLHKVNKLTLFSNSGLTTLEGLQNLTNAGNIMISSNSSLGSLHHLNNLQSIDGGTGSTGFMIEYNPMLHSLEGLEGLTYVYGNFFIQHNAALTDFCAISALILSQQSYSLFGNGYDPDSSDFIAGNCSH